MNYIFVALFIVSTIGSYSFAAIKPPFQKVFIVVFENEDANVSSMQPFISELARKGASLENFYAVARPSQPNYIAMTSGAYWGIFFNWNINIPTSHVGDLVEKAGKTWRVYAQGYPGGCNTAKVIGRYARKHNPFISYTNVQNNPKRCANIVNADQLNIDIANGNIADYNFYVPDLDNDGHDTGIAYGDRWLEKEFRKHLDNPVFMKDLLFVVTFDEASIRSLNNHIATVLYGNMVRPGSTSKTTYTHYSLLRTIEEALGLGTLGRKDASANIINDIWN